MAHPDLAALLRGELSNAAALQAAAHARTCGTCADDLIELSLGHGMLTSAVRTLGPGPLSHAEPDGSTLPLSLQRRVTTPRRRRLAAVAVAAVIAVGAAATATLQLVGGDDPGRTVAAERTATLEPVDPGSDRATGQVSMATDRQSVTRMRVDTVDLPRAPRGGFYYVWLFDPASDKMLPLGQVLPGHRASFDLPASLVAAYSAIDISLESDDGDPGHSVTSVLRASYAGSRVAPSTPSKSS
jgi:hypothetical protein